MTSITTLAEVDLGEAQADAITARDAGFYQVPVRRRGQWGVLERTPSGEDFIPAPDLAGAIAMVASPVDC